MPHQILKNGTRVHLIPVAGTEAATVLVLFKVGSRNEDKTVFGGSHFIEHLMFKGTKRRPNTLSISRELDQFGAEYNAYTGKDLTAYYVKIEGSKLPRAIDLLHDMLFHSKFDAAEMTREKKVIIEEIKMYDENPIMHIEDLLEEAMFDGHALGRNIAGSAKTMTEMKRSDVLRYRDHYYVPENTVVVVAGKIDRQVLNKIKNTFGRVAKKTVERNDEPYPGTALSAKPRIAWESKPLQQMQIALGFPTAGRNHKDTEALKLLATILGGTMSSRLFTEVRERRGLCYAVRAAVDAYDDVGVFSVRAGLDAKRLKEALQVILKEIEKMKKIGPTSKELKDAKDHVHGATLLRLEDSSAYAEFVGRQEIFLGQVESLEERMKKFAAVTRADIIRVSQEVLDKRLMSVAAIGPIKNKEELLRLL